MMVEEPRMAGPNDNKPPARAVGELVELDVGGRRHRLAIQDARRLAFALADAADAAEEAREIARAASGEAGAAGGSLKS
jgi:hypothetical protein